MIVSIHQPLFLPWSGYFHKMAVSDLHIVLDDVEFDSRSFVKRNRVRTKDGWTWLSVPVHSENKTEIRDVEIANEHPWQRKHLRALQLNYSNADYFDEYWREIQTAFEGEWDELISLNLRLIELLREELGVETELIRSSELEATGTKSDLMLNLCKLVGAMTYLSGPNGRDYLDEETFDEEGIEIRYHDFSHPTYPQVYEGFESHMSAIDLLLNCGPESRNVIFDENDSRDELVEAMRS